MFYGIKRDGWKMVLWAVGFPRPPEFLKEEGRCPVHIHEIYDKKMANGLQKSIQSESNELVLVVYKAWSCPDFSLRKQSWLARQLIPDEVLQSGNFHRDLFFFQM